MIIETQKELEETCAKLAENSYLAIDTEFLRDKTYYPKLCLVQMAGPGVEPHALDPLETDLDWEPFYELMADASVMKVFHAARQDLEIFFNEQGVLPTPIFDTQIAAMVCGYGDQVAYNALVRDLTGHALEKNAQFTDWSRRPLSDKQMTYALNDVVYLREVYEKINAQLESQSRTHWVFEETAILTDPGLYQNNPDTAWERIKIRSDKPEIFAILKELAAWREREAQRRNVPRGRVLKDDALADIALYKAKSPDSLKRIRSLPKDWTKNDKAKMLISLVQNARQSDPKSWPVRKRPDPLPRQLQPALEMLKMLLKINATQAHVAPKIIASADDLDRFVRGENLDTLPFLKGWRYELFGKDAQDMLDGKISLKLENKEIILTR